MTVATFVKPKGHAAKCQCWRCCQQHAVPKKPITKGHMKPKADKPGCCCWWRKPVVLTPSLIKRSPRRDGKHCTISRWGTRVLAIGVLALSDGGLYSSVQPIWSVLELE